MRYVFVGAGAVGSALGGLLAHTGGADVLLVARGDHARAVLDTGLDVRCPDTAFTVRVDVVTTPEQVDLTVDDVLVLTTKTQQAEVALAEWADVPVRGRAGNTAGRAADVLPVLVAANGVAAEHIALRYFSRVFAVCVWFPTVMIEPGRVIVRGAPSRGVFHIGRYPDSAVDSSAHGSGGTGIDTGNDADSELLADIAVDWGRAGCLVRRPSAIMQWKYRKLLSNLGNVLQALLGDASTVADIQQAADEEAQAVLGAANIAVVSDEEAQVGWQPPGLSFLPVAGEPTQLGGSSWQSLVRGTGTIETDFINGEIVLIARQNRTTAPVNACLTALARRAAREGHKPGAISADELRTIVRASGHQRRRTDRP